MTEVHAPYHFVPLSGWVYMPEWAHLVSHDVPLKEGYSGVIEYRLRNATHLCVGAKQNRGQSPSVVEWSKDPDGNLVIPDSSLKGLLRGHIEMGTFCKFNNVDDTHLSFRDISSANTRYAKELRETTAQAYWIKFDDKKGGWRFCKAKHTVLFHEDLNNFAGIDIVNSVRRPDAAEKKIPAEDKFKRYPLTNPAIQFELGRQTMQGTRGHDVNVECACRLGSGNLSGIPVFSGFRPGSNTYVNTRLSFSYMFYDEASEYLTIPESEELVRKLFDNHSASLVDYLKQNPHPTLGIPVFAREDKQGKIQALGFAKMPRKLYSQSTHQTIQNTQKMSHSENVFDMAELMFGALRDEALSLKSRITFSDAVCTQNKGVSTSSAVIMGQPQASYLPAYLEQQVDSNGNVYDLKQYEKQSQIKGTKRYAIQPEFNPYIFEELRNKLDIQSKMELLAPQSTFEGRIVFHNLNKQELGALLWAMQFQDRNEKAYHHSLGHGKSYGAGAVQFDKVALTVTANDGASALTKSEFVNEFTGHMNAVYPLDTENSWWQSPQIRHLYAIADQEQNEGKNLMYMPLNSPQHSNDVSYSSSVSGRIKQSLPDWRHGNEQLSRKEQIQQDRPSSFGKGRLYKLIETAPKTGDGSLSQIEKNWLKVIDDQKQLEKQQERLKNMSVVAKALYDLEQTLDSLEVKGSLQKLRERNPLVTETIDVFLNNMEKSDVDSANRLLELCRDKSRCAYLDLSKNKKKTDLPRHKEKLQALEVKAKSF